MKDETLKSKAKPKKPKLSEEEKREQVREALLHKKEYEKRAVEVVTALLETNISGSWLVSVAHQLGQAFYTDAVEERGLARLCGYPLCDQPHDPAKVKGQFRVSSRANKVYDIQERKLFCSARCFQASKFLLDQLETSPLWLRGADNPPKVKLYGEGDAIGNVTSSMGKLNVEETPENVNDEAKMPVGKGEEVGKEELFGSSSDSGSELEMEASRSKRRRVLSSIQTSRKVQEKETGAVVVAAVRSWFTVDTYRVVLGEEKLRDELRRGGVEGAMWGAVAGDPGLQEQYQARYRDLARRLDMLDLQEEQVEPADRLPLPSFQLVKRHMEEENLKLTSFLEGSTSYRAAAVVEEVEGQEPRLPPVDHHAQAELRRGIVMDRLTAALPPLLASLHLTLGELRPHLRTLVHSFHLLPTTITLAPAGWRLAALLLLRLLALREAAVAAAMERATDTLGALLADLGQTNDFLDREVAALTSAVMPLLEKYSITYGKS